MKRQKILIINGEPFNAVTATGITLTKLFKNYGEDNIIYIYSANIDVSKEIDVNYLKLSNKDLFESRNLSFKKVVNQGNLKKVSSQEAKVKEYKKKISGALDLFSYSISEFTLKEIKDFNPTLIYSNLGSNRIINLCNLLASKLNIPVVPHFLDDWLSSPNIYSFSFINYLLFKNINQNIIELMNKSTQGFCIGPEMKAEYETKFGIKFSCMMNPVEKIIDTAKIPNLDEKKIVFMGGLHLGRLETLIIFLKELENIKLPYKIELHLYIADSYHDKILEYKPQSFKLVIHNYINPAKVESELLKYDVGLHLESFNEKFKRFTRLSISTKIPQYMGLGLPILAYSPLDVSSTKYIETNNTGVIVNNNLENSIGLIFEKYSFFSHNAINVARKSHSSELQFQQMLSVFNEIL
ncbi:hypothetical protein KTI61_13695 [Acinetobacter pittii]|uniref:hypothetical protein n=1 Tax=Acinetobacter pittii TaxID=48296 RepID=UPI0021CD85A1|nr:hypothetical protein [Acinetobacter pittii]MCU4550034.1 hypothetical protein [Acinetobacter pittii]